MLITSNVFFISIGIFFRSDWVLFYILFLFLWFSLSSWFLLLSLVSICMSITLSSLPGKLFPFCFVLFLSFYFVLLFKKVLLCLVTLCNTLSLFLCIRCISYASGLKKKNVFMYSPFECCVAILLVPRARCSRGVSCVGCMCLLLWLVLYCWMGGWSLPPGQLAGHHCM